ncbi:MAG TPA: hypothetical protein VLZ77_16590 [Acidimicrobiales bacterium]|nr:hypothetical protein [Acidimicrobiales bacterium]
MKRQRMVALSVVLVAGLLALSATPAAAGHRTKPSKFQGPAPGSVRCAISVRVKYSPPMTNSGGQAKHTSVRISNCHTSDSRVSIHSAKVQKTSSTAAFSASQLNCQPVNSLPPAVNLQWRGTYTQTLGNRMFRGKATYSPSAFEVSSEQVVSNGSGDRGLALTGSVAPTESFGGSASMSLYTTDTPHAFAATCAGHGFHSLKLSGTITIG